MGLTRTAPFGIFLSRRSRCAARDNTRDLNGKAIVGETSVADSQTDSRCEGSTCISHIDGLYFLEGGGRCGE